MFSSTAEYGHCVTKFWAKLKEIIFEDTHLNQALVWLSCLKLVQLCQTPIEFSSNPVFVEVDCKFHSTVFTGFYCRLTYRYLTHQGL